MDKLKKTERQKYIDSFTEILNKGLKEGLYYDVDISISITQTDSSRNKIDLSQHNSAIMAWVGPDKGIPDKGIPDKIIPRIKQKLGRTMLKQDKEYLGLGL